MVSTGMVRNVVMVAVSQTNFGFYIYIYFGIKI